MLHTAWLPSSAGIPPYGPVAAMRFAELAVAGVGAVALVRLAKFEQLVR
jgi:hypothetical protein